MQSLHHAFLGRYISPVLSALLWFGLQAQAQDASLSLDSIQVTANKIEENPQEIPQSLTALDDSALLERGIKESQDLYQSSPNLHLNKIGPMSTTSFASMRGVVASMTGAPVVGVFVDGVYYPSTDIDLIDIERIEILRGPQGTLYGRNTAAGAINIITKKPTGKIGGKIGVDYGAYQDRSIDFMLNGTILPEKLYTRISGQYGASDGYFESSTGDNDHINESKNLNLRSNFYLIASDSLSLDISADIQSYRSNYAEFNSLENFKKAPHKIDGNFLGRADKDAQGISLKADYDMDSLRLTSITSYRHENIHNDNDIDFTAVNMMNLYTQVETKTLSEELRLAPSESSALRWLVGLHLFHEEANAKNDFEFVPFSILSQQEGKTNTLGTALFAQASYDLSDSLTLGTGIRYDREKKDFDYSWHGGAMMGYTEQSGSSEKSFNALLPKASLSYKIDENLMPYLSVAKGFKSGGFNLNSNPGEAYDSEYTWNYEAGIKSSWLSNQLELNLAAFKIDWEDIQVEMPSYPDYVIQNAGEATSKGFELEARAKLTQDLSLFGGVGYTAAKFDSYTQGGNDYSGKYVPNVPKTTYNLGATYRFLDGYFISAEYIGTGKIYYDFANTQSQSSYHTINAKIGYQNKRFTAYLWGKNLTDEEYFTRAFNMSGAMYGRMGDPRRIGLSMAWNF